MSKVFSALEDAITNGSWADVCKFYTKMTGKPISPPEQKPQFNIETANKKTMYAEVKKLMPDIGPIKNFTLEELKEIYSLRDVEVEEEFEDQVITPAQLVNIETVNAAANPEFTYVNPKKKDKMINMDKRGFNARLTDFRSYGDEKEVSRSMIPRSQNKVTARCVRCSRVAQVSPLVTIAGREDGIEKSYICAKCS